MSSPTTTIPWQTEQLRLTLFPLQPPSGSVGERWRLLTGLSPQTEITQRQGDIPVYIAEGILNNSPLRLVFGRGRVDLLWEGPPPFSDPSEITLDWPKKLHNFRNLAETWFTTFSDSVQRIALGVILRNPVSTLSEGYQLLQSFLPGGCLGSENVTDFLYRVNRPREAQSYPGLRLNRLSEWSVVTTIGYIVRGVNPSSALAQNEQLWTQASFDLNTDANHTKPLEPQAQKAIFSELVDLAQELAIKGVTP